ncbi:MAG TPA: energy transducer TonB [Gemmatimonadales bacterium]|nr:energy transducer TonB [Gemmatimonadales bacterium]
MIREKGPVLLALGVIACGRSGPAPSTGSAPAEEPPVAVNAEPAVQYPPDLYDRRVEGEVVLRLFVDSSGRLSPESTRVSESSGFAALDSAAVRGASRLRYAPARRRGLPVATAFLQAVEFRHPGGGAAPSPPAAPPGTPQATPPRRDTVRPRPVAPPDSIRVRRDSSARRPDSAPPTPRPDSTRTQPDSNASAP